MPIQKQLHQRSMRSKNRIMRSYHNKRRHNRRSRHGSHNELGDAVNLLVKYLAGFLEGFIGGALEGFLETGCCLFLAVLMSGAVGIMIGLLIWHPLIFTGSFTIFLLRKGNLLMR